MTLYRLAKSRETIRDFSGALESFKGAREQLKASGNRAAEALAVEGMGRALFQLQKPDEAIVRHNEALKLFHESGDLAGQAEALANLGLAHYRSLGNAKEALPLYVAALALFEDLGNTDQQAILLNNLGQMSLDMGQPADAIAWFEQSLSIKSESPEVLDSHLLALIGLGTAHHYRGENRLALDYLRRVRESPRKDLGAERARMVALRRLASILLDAGPADPESLKRARAAAEKARTIAQRINAPAAEGYASAILGWTLELQGSHADALKVLASAQKLFQAHQDKSSESGVLFGIAHAERELGRLTRAQEAMERSLGLVENLRSVTSSLEMRSSYWAQLRPRYDFYIDLLMELDRLHPGKGYDVRAFEVSEGARARVVLDELIEAGTKLRATANPRLLERDRALRREIEHALQERQKLPQDGAPNSHSQMERLDLRLSELMALREAVGAALRASSPRYDELLGARPRSLAQIQREVLDRDTILLSYWLGEKESILWRIDRGSLRAYRLPARDQIERLAIKLRDHFSTGRIATGESEAARVAAQLGDQLLGPVAHGLDATHLLILPDGALQYVPFAALAPPGAAAADGWPERPLIVDHDIVRLPSASALALLKRQRKGRRPAPHELAVLANPVFRSTDPRVSRLRPRSSGLAPSSAPSEKIGSLPDLPFSEQEAREILHLVPAGEGFSALGFEARLETAMSPKLGLYRMVHFATHSLLAERPDLSGLVLSQFDAQGRPQDGFLSVLDLYELDLPVELVVLSACQTDQGQDPTGEGIGRLTRGFLYAGARRVTVTLWSIRDRATADFMIRFYRSLLRDGLSPAAALRQAQLSMRAEKRWRSPYYWAGFVLQGEW